MNKEICFYHRADLDGHCSGAIVKHFRPAVELVGLDYGDEFPWDTVSHETLVFMVDFSLQPFERMLELKARCQQLVWIDHHVSAIRDEQQFGSTEPLIGGLQEVGRAGCELCWEFFAADKPIPKFVRLLGRYDVWDHQPGVLEFQMGMRAYPETRPELAPQVWLGLLDEIDGADIVEAVSERGLTILRYQEAQDTKYCSGFAFNARLPPMNGQDRPLHVIAMNRGAISSRAFTSVYDAEKHDAMCSFVRTADGRWKVSLYTTRDDVDCGAYCKERGGGGHKQAAGYIAEECPF